ncbi:MAG: thiamine pyrophosphate-dependent dehydrogenase E1 component subunit alpha [Aestuariibacter sp.]
MVYSVKAQENSGSKQAPAEVIELFIQMLRIRRVEEAIAERYPEQKMRCPTHLSIGQEAVAVGVSYGLQCQDKVFSSHRAHAHYLAKGGSLKKLIAELYGKATGCTAGRGGSMHLCDLDAGFVASTAIVANSIPVAVGQALNMQSQKKDGIVIAYFGDGATEEGAFYESVNFAVLKSLPILFVCENNFYSVYSPLSVRQPENHSISRMVKEMGIPAQELDGNNVLKVHQTASQSITDIRSGRGPQFIECFTYRHREHCGPNFDDDLGYRPSEEVTYWHEKDPILCFQQHCDVAGIVIPSITSLLSEQEPLIQREIAQAFDFAESSPFPDESTATEYVYANK